MKKILMNSKNSNFSINELMRIIKLEKQYLKLLREKYSALSTVLQNNYKALNSSILLKNYEEELVDKNNVILYIVTITYTNTNTFLHVTDFSGKLMLFSSGGMFGFRGDSSKSRIMALNSFYAKLTDELSFLKNKVIALHLVNIPSGRFYIVKDISKIFYVKAIRFFSVFPYNGCRKKKVRRKKFRTKRKSRRNG